MGFASPDDDTLILAVSFHVCVGVVTDGKDVWRHFPDLLVSVGLDLLCRVDGQQLVGVDGHQDGACVCL